MHYFSTRGISPDATFREAIEIGQPLDKGLFFPSEIPKFSSEFLPGLSARSNADVAFDIMRPYIDGEIPDRELFQICAACVNFPFPLVKLNRNIQVLELFHGPTLAFKDVGARFMSGCLGYFSRTRDRKTLVIVATSGDTGGAVAAGFEGVSGIEVVILYPKGRVSEFQARQLNTRRDNVLTLEVRGSFDDCQTMAKEALADPDLRKTAFVTSANSINVARWLPQQLYYVFALKEWGPVAPVFAVPSGNFGNLAAGALAYTSGLPAEIFIAACNANDTVPRFMLSRKFEPRPSVPTLSNAMDVGDPSNFPRLTQVFGNDIEAMSEAIEAVSVDDRQTADTIRSVYAENNYVLDPHAAVAYRALADFLSDKPDFSGILLATAHPRKFEVVREILGTYNVETMGKDDEPEQAERREIDPEYGQLREILAALT